MNDQARTTKRAAIGLEPLEGRRLLTIALPTTLVAPLRADLTYGITYLDLQGKAHGTTSTVVGNPDLGQTLHLHGSGHVTGLGQVKVSGTLVGTGFIASGHVSGTLTLSNSQGSFTLHIEGPATNGFQPPRSGIYQFQSTQATGRYQKDFGNGTIQLDLAHHAFTITFRGRPNVY